MESPKWESYLIPCLQVLSDGETHRRRDLIADVADLLELSEEEKAIMIPSGIRAQYIDRANWAIAYLSRYRAISSPRRSMWHITDKGQRLLAKFPQGMTRSQLRTESGEDYQESAKPKPARKKQQLVVQQSHDVESELTPLEQLEEGQRRNEAMVAEELLICLHEREPAFFEQAVLDLLMAMGYGGSFGNATRTQLSNDGGIDGVIDQDALGLSRIYVQAKRYEMSSTVGRPDVQAFAGALHGAQASQGVFFTTASFTTGAIDYAKSVQSRVVLIDGDLLSRLMIKYGVGVQTQRTVKIVSLDEDYFGMAL